MKAAVALFSRQGFHGTRTREIARLADVSEVTVFRYFDHKDDIFWSALQSCFSSIKPRLNLLQAPPREDNPELMLPEIVCLLVDIVTYSPELMRLIAVALLELHGPAEELCRENLSPLFAAISGYLARNIDAGRMRNLDPAIVTAALAFPVLMQPELSKMMNGSTLSKLGGREAINQYSDFWVKVLIPAHPDGFARFTPAQAAEPPLEPVPSYGRDSQ